MSHTPDGYTPRPAFWAMRFGRLLFRSDAVQEIGQTAALICLQVAMMEDTIGYRGPVTFWNEQLMRLVDVKDRHAFQRARSKAIEAGWLAYMAPPIGSKSVPGKYFTTIPENWQDASDSDTEDVCETLEHAYQRGFLDGTKSQSTGDLTTSVKPTCSNDHVGQTPYETPYEAPYEAPYIPPLTLTYLEYNTAQKKNDSQLPASTHPDVSMAIVEPLQEPTPSQDQETFALTSGSAPSKPKRTKPAKRAKQVDLPPIPAELDTPDFCDWWGKFVAHRKSKRNPLDNLKATLVLEKLVPMGVQGAIESIKNSIRSGYPDVYPPRSQQSTKGNHNGKSNQQTYHSGRNVPGTKPYVWPGSQK